jgi:hypothetical protein
MKKLFKRLFNKKTVMKVYVLTEYDKSDDETSVLGVFKSSKEAKEYIPIYFGGEYKELNKYIYNEHPSLEWIKNIEANSYDGSKYEVKLCLEVFLMKK